MEFIRGLLAFLSRLMIAAIFVMSAVGSKIPAFNAVAERMAGEGIPQPRILLVGAIAFLILGGLSVAIGYRARLGALLLLIFLGAATYYFHDFWNAPPEARQDEVIAFMKNLALMGTMLFLIVTGAGPGSLDARRAGAGLEDVAADESDDD